MPRKAKLFSSSAGSVVRGYLKFRANIPPRWIRNARSSRKGIEPEIVQSLSALRRLRKNRPRARVAMNVARSELKAVLRRWEIAYNKEFLSWNLCPARAPAKWRVRTVVSSLVIRFCCTVESGASAPRRLKLPFSLCLVLGRNGAVQ